MNLAPYLDIGVQEIWILPQMFWIFGTNISRFWNFGTNVLKFSKLCPFEVKGGGEGRGLGTSVRFCHRCRKKYSAYTLSSLQKPTCSGINNFGYPAQAQVGRSFKLTLAYKPERKKLLIPIIDEKHKISQNNSLPEFSSRHALPPKLYPPPPLMG